jgi:starvation-inducible DNA-binding protein
MQNKILADKMKVVLATSFAFYLKAHNFHWNVEGPNFPQYHEFFGKLYEEVHAAIDDIAEHIRAIDAYAPGSFTRFAELSIIKDEIAIPNPIEMCKRLHTNNDQLIKLLMEAQQLSETSKEVGLSNFLQDRIDIHKKHQWMLRSIIKAQ